MLKEQIGMPVENRKRCILRKQRKMNEARVCLKREFVGIDRVIDEVLDAAGSWYLFPELQEKPIVINLWGLTGVGKSSLVARLAELLNYKERFFQFDLGECESNSGSMKEKLESIYSNANGSPAIIAFDEFQYARTLDSSLSEIRNTTSRVVWQILDSGKFHCKETAYRPERLYEMIEDLRHMLKNGVKVSGGKVIAGRKYFVDHLGSYDYEEFDGHHFYNTKKPVSFVPTYLYDMVLKLSHGMFSNNFELTEELSKLNGQQTIQLLAKIYESSKQQRMVDCTHSLIFVLGNLDEAYFMSGNFSPDMSADEFHEESLKITVPEIKRSLKKRFRNEQIARLGNIHVIYPAFSSKSFTQIIKLELDKISERSRSKNNLKISFDESIIQLIYDEGVYPTMGTRPVFSTISRIVTSKLGAITAEMLIRNFSELEVIISYSQEKIKAEYKRGNKTVHSAEFKQELELEKIRKESKDDAQAITAVHETGHAIISTILFGVIPEYIMSTSAEPGSGGLVCSKINWQFTSKAEILSRLALYLAGLAAERIVFGEENVTSGAQSDIERATSFVSDMLKCYGMGEFPASYHAESVETRDYLHDYENRISKQSELLLASGLELAESVLRDNEMLLLKIADHLSDNKIIRKSEIEQLILLYPVRSTYDNFSAKVQANSFFRNHLKERVCRLGISGGESSEDAMLLNVLRR